MKREKIFISTIAPDSSAIALKYGLGLEIAEYCTAWNMDDEFEATHSQVTEKISSVKNLALHAPFNELFPCAIDPLARKLAAQRYTQAINLARDYGADRVIIHGGYNPRMYYPVWYTEQSVVFWREFMKTAPEDITICLENVFEPTPEMLADIVRQVGDKRLRMCLDVGHVNAYSEVPVLKWIEDCADVIGHYHMHNNSGDMDSHNSLADGSIPMKEVFAAAEEMTEDATITLETLTAEESAKWLSEQKII